MQEPRVTCFLDTSCALALLGICSGGCDPSQSCVALCSVLLAVKGDQPALFANAIGVVASARNNSHLAREVGMTQGGSLQGSVGQGGPSLAIVLKEVKALEFNLTLTPA